MTATVLLAGLAVACGGGGGGGANPQTVSADRDKQAQQAALDFAECMREHGVDVPDPQPGERGLRIVGAAPGAGAGASGGEVSAPAEFKEADEACRHFLEDVIGDADAKIDPEEQDRALKFAQCMREHGVDMPDPDFSKGGISIQIGGEGSRPDPDVLEAAQKACEPLFGPRGGVMKSEKKS